MRGRSERGDPHAKVRAICTESHRGAGAGAGGILRHGEAGGDELGGASK